MHVCFILYSADFKCFIKFEIGVTYSTKCRSLAEEEREGAQNKLLHRAINTHIQNTGMIISLKYKNVKKMCKYDKL